MEKNDQERLKNTLRSAKARLIERVALRLQKRDRSARTVNRAFVIAHKEEIREALEGGFSIKDVWETLSEEGAVPFSYQAFRRHVNGTILNSKPSSKTAQSSPAKPAPMSSSPSKSKQSAGIPGFTFDPNPNRKDLF